MKKLINSPISISASLILKNKATLILNLKNSLYYFGGTAIQFFIAIFTLPIFSKYLEPKDFAIIGYFNAINAFFIPLFYLNLHSYYIANYYAAKGKSTADDMTFGLNFLNVSNLLVGIIGYFVISLYFHFFNVQFPLTPYLLIVFLYLFVDKYLVFYQIACRINKKGLAFFLISASVAIFNAIFSLLLVVELKTGAAGKLAGPMFSEMLIVAVVVFILIRSKQFRFSLKFTAKKISDSMKFSWPLVLAGYSYYPIANIDRIFLERLKNPTEFGFYSIGLLVSSYVGVFFNAIFQAFEPDLYRFIQNGKKKKYLLFALSFILMMGVITVGFIVFSKFILSILTSGRYTRASEYANIFIIGLLLIKIGGFFEHLFKAYKKTKYVLTLNIFVGVISVIAYYAMIHWLGFKGANITRVLVGALYIIVGMSLYFFFRKNKSNFDVNKEFIEIPSEDIRE